MAIYDAKRCLPGGQPGPWGDPVSLTYEHRDVLLYAVGIGVSLGAAVVGVGVARSMAAGAASCGGGARAALCGSNKRTRWTSPSGHGQ